MAKEAVNPRYSPLSETSPATEPISTDPNVEVELDDSTTQIEIAGFADGPSSDAFGRLRTAGTGNRFDVEFIYDKQPQLVDEVTNTGGTATHDTNARDVVLAINNTTNGTEAALYSHYDVPYTAGSSQLIDITGTLDGAGIGGGTAEVFLRSKVTGTVAETIIPQGSWAAANTDVDWSTSQIFSIDFQSLKVGRIRFNLVRNGIPVNVAEITNDNTRATGYWQRPTLPVCWSIYNSGGETIAECAYGDEENAVGFRYKITANATATMRAICATVKSEGGESLINMPGFPDEIGNLQSPTTVSTTEIPIISIRPTATFNSLANRGLFVPLNYEIYTDNPIYYHVYYRPALTGAVWTSVDATHSGIEYDVTATAFTGGIKVTGGKVSTDRNQATAIGGLLGRTIMSLGRTGTSDILTVTAVRESSNAEVEALFNWKEIR